MRPEHVVSRVDRNGAVKQIVLYAGLLEEAHKHGLRSMRTGLLQPPSPQNGERAIVYAQAILVDSEGVEREFHGLGDASPADAQAMPAVRMAETRAKTRALRDALGLDVIGEEEFPVSDVAAPGPMPSVAPTSPPRVWAGATVYRPSVSGGAGGTGQSLRNPDGPPTPKQLNLIQGRAAQAGLDETALSARLGVPLTALTKSQASGIIDQLMNGAAITSLAPVVGVAVPSVGTASVAAAAQPDELLVDLYRAQVPEGISGVLREVYAQHAAEAMRAGIPVPPPGEDEKTLLAQATELRRALSARAVVGGA